MPSYGSGAVYGGGSIYGGGIILISPGSGPISGGTQVEISGFDLLDTSCDDDFSGILIDPFKWTTSVNGVGSSASEDGKLHLVVGIIPGSHSRIESVDTFTDTDLEVSFEVITDIAALPAIDSVELASMRLLVDSNNYAQISRKTGGDYRDRYEATVVISGVAVESAFIATNDLSGKFRIIRRGSTVYLYANNIEVLRYNAFSTAASKARIGADNMIISYPINTDFYDFVVHTMVVLGTEPMLDAEVLSNDRIIGTTPPGVAVDFVNLYLATCALSFPILVNAFQYTDLSQFMILSTLDRSTQLAITNDPVLRNLRANRPGFTR